MLKQRQTEAGFSLIEVLVAVVILSIGVLGVAGLQLVSLKQSEESTRQGLVALHLQSAADTLRIGERREDVEGDLNEALSEQAQLGAPCNNNDFVSISPVTNPDGYSIEIRWAARENRGNGEASSEANQDDCVVRRRVVRAS